MTIVLRAATLADIPRMHQIEDDAGELFAGLGLIDIEDMALVSIGDHGHAIDAGLSLIAEVDGRAAGFAIGARHGEDVYLHELDVDRAYQKQGVGAALVTAFVDLARRQGAGAVYLSTFRDPPWNAPFYRKLGFRDVARGDYLPWMIAIETEQAKFLDIATRVFMRVEV
ncbi:MAG: GNAT family N-acetyltransferase [Hyphomonadaceae bacterium]|nr:GNAT family N-acetyltransferase [Hyphomonadaceae bacterium]